MPRITILRVITFVFLAWLCMIGAWFFLPSPQVPRALRSHHIQETLRSGQVITTVLDWAKQTDECAAYAIDWQLVPDYHNDYASLTVGSAKINLTSLALEYSPPQPYISTKMTAEVRSGDLDHIINMPWFDYADANLFHHQMHGFPGYLDIRIIMINAKEVQIWKDSPSWDAHDVDSQLAHLDDDRRATGLLATFSKIQTFKGARGSISNIVVSELKGRLPSKTYETRAAMLDILAPTLMVVLFLFEALVAPALWYCLIFIGPVVALYTAIIALCWCTYGHSTFSAWTRTSSLTKFWYSEKSRKVKSDLGIWGSSGPMMAEDLEGGKRYDDRTRLDKNLSGWRVPARFRASNAKA